MDSFRGKTFAARWLDNCAVFVHSLDQPTQEEWAQIVEVYRQHPKRREQPVLVYSDGGAPNTVQRAEITKFLGDVKPRMAVLTESVITRTASKALSLLMPEFRVFNVNQLDHALTHLKLDGRDRAQVTRVLDELRRALSSTILGPR
jgi:hypothetical protein